MPQSWSSAGAYTYPDVSNNGWQHTQKEVKTKHYNLQRSFPAPSNTGIPIDQNRLKYEFSRMFAEQFINDKVITIRDERNHMHPGEIMYRAEMIVAPGATTIIQADKTFFAYNQKWSEADIQKALKNTFPERLL